jgi:hypothetical protein
MSPEDVARVVADAVAKERRRLHRSRGIRAMRVGPFLRQHGITEGEWRVLVASAEYPTHAKAAEALGIGLQTFKNHLTSAKRRKQASSLLDLYFRMGWLVTPDLPLGPPITGGIPDTLLVRGHMVVHVAACQCRAEGPA